MIACLLEEHPFSHTTVSQADHAARPLLYQHHKSLVLHHKKRANKTANMKLSLDTRITKALLKILQQPKKHMEVGGGGGRGQVKQWQKTTKTTEL